MHTPRIEQEAAVSHDHLLTREKKGTIEALQIVSFAQASFCFTFFTGAQKGRKAKITCEN